MAGFPSTITGWRGRYGAPSLGRKNHYCSRSERGARTTAILYSLIETAKLNGFDPAAYLLDAAETALAEPGAVTLL